MSLSASKSDASIPRLLCERLALLDADLGGADVGPVQMLPRLLRVGRISASFCKNFDRTQYMTNRVVRNTCRITL